MHDAAGGSEVLSLVLRKKLRLSRTHRLRLYTAPNSARLANLAAAQSSA
jgi:hypothetical protein